MGNRTNMKKLIYLTLFLLILSNVMAQKVSFTASAKKVVAVGEQFRLTYSVNAKPSSFSPPDLSAFNYSGPSQSSSSNIQMINGKVSQSVNYTYTYYLQAVKAGKFTLGKAKVQVNGKSYTSNTLEIEVVKGAAPNQNAGNRQNAGQITGDDLFVRVEVNKRNVFVGEQIIAKIKIYTRVSLVGFEDSKFPNFNGFWTQEIQTPSQISLQRENVNGNIYQVGTLKEMILFPQKSGDLIIEPADITCVLRKRVRPRSFFDNGYRDYSKKIVSPKVKITVKQLPFNKPENFTGAVGSYKFETSIDKNQCKTNDAITLKVKISGNGNIKLVEKPNINFPADFEVYKPKENVNVKNTKNGSVGKKTFEYVLIPRHAGDFKIPPIEFCYFAPTMKSYKTLSGQEFVISVEKGEENDNNIQYIGAGKKNIVTQDVDIRYIKISDLSLSPVGKFYAGSLSFYLVYGISSLIFVLIIVIRRKKIKENANIAGMKNKKANKISRKRLKKASLHLKNSNKEAFYVEVLGAIWGYLSDKLSIPVSELNKENVQQHLEKHAIAEQTITNLTDLIDKCEFARYAPSAVSGEMDTVFKSAENIIGTLESKLR